MSEIVPDYPPWTVVISAEPGEEPRVVDKGGLADYLLEAILNRCAMQHSTTWELAEEDS